MTNPDHCWRIEVATGTVSELVAGSKPALSRDGTRLLFNQRVYVGSARSDKPGRIRGLHERPRPPRKVAAITGDGTENSVAAHEPNGGRQVAVEYFVPDGNEAGFAVGPVEPPKRRIGKVQGLDYTLVAWSDPAELIALRIGEGISELVRIPIDGSTELRRSSPHQQIVSRSLRELPSIHKR